MKIILPGLLCLAVAGCGLLPPPTPPMTPAQAACRRLAEKDPKVQSLSLLRVSSGWANIHYRADYEQALQAAESRCMTGRGQPPASGVEKVR